MSVTKENFVAELNKALEWEYASAIQYIQHAASITGAEYVAIADELVTHVNEEISHALKLANAIVDLKGVPTMEVEVCKTDADSKTMLEQDLESEEIAIALYKKLIPMAEELKEYGVRQVLEEILKDEEEHRRDLLNALGR
ncbi:MAG: ferritin-like domain-containing protein [bacterium]|nr:ferritin-like domain-containing protein [bacterium]